MRLFIFFVVLFCIGCQENNFSDAALEEFFVLDRSLDANNRIIEQGIRIATREIRVNAYEKIRYLPILNKANEIESISLSFHAYIDKLRDSLVAESGGAYTKEEAEKLGKPELEGRPIGQNDKKIPHKIFILGDNGSKGNKEPQGVVLYKKILNLRTAYIDAIAKMWNNGGVNGTTFADSSKKVVEIKELKDEMTIYGIDDYRPEIHENKTWAEFTFENKPVAAIYPILRKLQNDAKILEAIIVNFLHFQQSSISICGFNYPFATTLSSNPTVRLGETYEAQIALVEKVEDAVFTVSVNNQNIKLNYGIATYKVKPTSIGKKKYTAKIALKNPFTGEIFTFAQDFHYEVLQQTK